MKQFAILYVQAIIIFLGVHITPAAIATIISCDLDVYMLWITSPLYNAIMVFTSLFVTIAALEHLNTK
jgi:hypothetical protein